MFSKAILVSLVVAATTTTALPLQKRIAQVIADSTAKWEQACLAAGGADKCNPLSITAFTTLLAAAGPCDQQNAGDQMIDLAKTLNNDADMIKFTQLFVQQPRNSPDSFSIPYCQQAPKNSELDGLFQCQFQGVQPEFVGNLQPGAQGTIPFGQSNSVSPPGSCPAHTSGGIADGSQLTDITQDPGVGNASSGSNNSSGDDNSSFESSSTSTSTTSTKTKAASCSATPAATTTSSSSNVASGGSSSTSSFALQNGKDAQQLNAQFESLTADSSCTEGESACIGSSFALCANGKFAVMGCAGGTTCAALPLVNKPGTSVTCTTQSDALACIAATGATGGLTGSG